MQTRPDARSHPRSKSLLAAAHAIARDFLSWRSPQRLGGRLEEARGPHFEAMEPRLLMSAVVIEQDLDFGRFSYSHADQVINAGGLILEAVEPPTFDYGVRGRLQQIEGNTNPEGSFGYIEHITVAGEFRMPQLGGQRFVSGADGDGEIGFYWDARDGYVPWSSTSNSQQSSVRWSQSDLLEQTISTETTEAISTGRALSEYDRYAHGGTLSYDASVPTGGDSINASISGSQGYVHRFGRLPEGTVLTVHAELSGSASVSGFSPAVWRIAHYNAEGEEISDRSKAVESREVVGVLSSGNLPSSLGISASVELGDQVFAAGEAYTRPSDFRAEQGSEENYHRIPAAVSYEDSATLTHVFTKPGEEITLEVGHSVTARSSSSYHVSPYPGLSETYHDSSAKAAQESIFSFSFDAPDLPEGFELPAGIPAGAAFEIGQNYGGFPELPDQELLFAGSGFSSEGLTLRENYYTRSGQHIGIENRWRGEGTVTTPYGDIELQERPHSTSKDPSYGRLALPADGRYGLSGLGDTRSSLGGLVIDTERSAVAFAGIPAEEGAERVHLARGELVVEVPSTVFESPLLDTSAAVPLLEGRGSLGDTETGSRVHEVVLEGLTPGDSFTLATDNSDRVLEATGPDTVLGLFDEQGTLLNADDDGSVFNDVSDGTHEPAEYASGLSGNVLSDGTIRFRVTGYGDNDFDGIEDFSISDEVPSGHGEFGEFRWILALGTEDASDLLLGEGEPLVLRQTVTHAAGAVTSEFEGVDPDAVFQTEMLGGRAASVRNLRLTSVGDPTAGGHTRLQFVADIEGLGDSLRFEGDDAIILREGQPPEFPDPLPGPPEALVVDLDIDSDNTAGLFGGPDGGDAEDAAENGLGLGSGSGLLDFAKVVPVSFGDADGDAVPDFADGFGRFGGLGEAYEGSALTPLSLSVTGDTAEAAAAGGSLAFRYDGSDPNFLGVFAEPRDGLSNTGPGRTLYSLPDDGGHLRLWADLDGDGVRGVDDYLAPGQAYGLGDLGLLNGQPIDLFLEAVGAGANPASTVGVDFFGVTLEQASADSVLVHAAVAGVAADADRDGVIRLDGSDAPRFNASLGHAAYSFWLNDDRDVWVQEDARQPENLLRTEENAFATDLVADDLHTDASTGILGRDSGVDDDATLEVIRRDLEDAFAVGLYLPEAITQQAGVELELQLTGGGAVQLHNTSDTELRGDGIVDAHGHVANERISAAAASQLHTALNDAPELAYRLEAGEAVGLKPEWHSPGGVASGLVSLLVEGIEAVDGELILRAVRDGVTLAESSLRLVLEPVQAFYEQHRVLGGDQLDASFARVERLFDENRSKSRARLEDGTGVQTQAADASGDYLLIVHGWGMDLDEKLAQADTFYKRNFWAGYEGEAGALIWAYDTPPEGPIETWIERDNYNRAEHVARHTGGSLLRLLRQLNRRDGVDALHLAAHSMGNVVASEALRRSFDERGGRDVVDTYVLMNSAAAADAYVRLGRIPEAARQPVDGDGWDTPSLYQRHPDTSQPVFHNVRRAAGSIFNYVNADDYALRFWNINQRQKPDPTSSRFVYLGGRDLGARARFQETSDRYFEWRVRNNREGLNAPSRSPVTDSRRDWWEHRRLYFSESGPGSQLSVTERRNNEYLVYAMAAESRAWAVGRVGGTPEAAEFDRYFTAVRDLDNETLGSFKGAAHHHSGQFNRTYGQNIGFYTQLLSDLGGSS